MAFRRALQSLIIGEDAFGLVVNQDQRWRFRTEAQKVEEFRGWIESQLKTDILGDDKLTSDDWWQKYVEEGYRKGTGRAFDDTKKPVLSADEQKSVSDFYRGTKEEFLRSSFARPESVEKIKLLAGRVLTDLKGVTGYMAQQMVRELTDGLARGENPRTIARRMVKSLDIAKGRATTIARTEIVRAHAEGQLDGLERLGVTEVGVMVEWVTAGDSRVCPQCQPLSGVVLKISEARGSIPRHPNCRCAWVPANVGESKGGQQRGRKAVEQAMDKSIAAETGEKGRDASRWTGADAKIAETRPKSVLDTPAKKETAAKLLQSIVKHTGDTSKEFRELIDSVVKSLPVAHLKLMAESGLTVKTGALVTDLIPALKGVTPRGWSPGMTWDAAEGCWLQDTQSALVCEKVRYSGAGAARVTPRYNVLDRITAHEIGHGMDWVLGGGKPGDLASRSAEVFTKAYYKEATTLLEKHPEAAQQLTYMIQPLHGKPTAAGASEVMAEAYAATQKKAMTEDRGFEKHFPETIKAVKQLLKEKTK